MQLDSLNTMRDAWTADPDNASLGMGYAHAVMAALAVGTITRDDALERFNVVLAHASKTVMGADVGVAFTANVNALCERLGPSVGPEVIHEIAARLASEGLRADDFDLSIADSPIGPAIALTRKADAIGRTVGSA